MNKLINFIKAFILLASVALFSGCADWNSIPVAVDDNFGDAVRQMVKAQTLNPSASYIRKPVFGLDGQKSEGNIKAYRSGNIDLRKGKTPLKVEIDN